jgi:hypothetical protein
MEAKMGIRKTLQRTTDQLMDKADEVIGDIKDKLKTDEAPVGLKPEPVHRKVLLIIYDPVVPSDGKKKLHQVLKWNNPDKLTEGHIADMRECSYGYANYKVVDRIEVDGFPVKADGFSYKADDFVRAWRARKGFHEADAVDYMRIVKEFKLIERVSSGEIDEVWLHAFPYAGFYESIMVGPEAFWCNAPPLKGTDHSERLFVIMGFNYQRGIGEMLENQGHRAESIMKHVFRKKKGQDNLWEKFTRYDKTHPGKAEVGIVHYAPNSLKDYDWGNQTKVRSRCDDWYNFPNFTGQERVVDCSEWGNGDTRLHHVWWFKHMPHITGSADGISYNWWEYIIDPNRVK